MDLKQAFRNYKQNPKHFGKPKFKKKSHSKLSYKTNNQQGSVRIENNKLILPKFRPGIKIVEHRKINGIIKSVTIERTSSDYYTKCYNCYTKHDRDVNAAINIKNKGLEMIS